MTEQVHVGLSLMFEDGFREAVLPLFEEGLVDALEISFEVEAAPLQPVPWAEALLDHYAQAGRLWGHGVTMSPLTVDDRGHHTRWLAEVAAACGRRSLCGVSEHYGFMRAGDIDGGAPLPPPAGPAAIAQGRHALRRLADATGVAVGLENLALALGEDDVWAQGPALAAMLEPTDGYLVLDLHNLDCQVHNFDVDRTALLESYPLSRVRCMHVSGGSWTRLPGRARPFRRDTHDDVVPRSVIEWLPDALARCPNVEAVFVERLGPTVKTPDDAAAVRDEFRAVREVVRRSPGAATKGDHPPCTANAEGDASGLVAWQDVLLRRLAAGDPPNGIRRALRADPRLEPYRAQIERLDDDALRIAVAVVARWHRPQA